MNNEDLEKLSESLEDIWSIIGIFELSDYTEYHTKYVIQMWFNDMFAWATSWTIDFLIPNSGDDINKLKMEFRKWYEQEGKILLDKFEFVPYPNTNNIKEAELYFCMNCEIGHEIEMSINKYCNIELNDSFDIEKIKEELKHLKGE